MYLVIAILGPEALHRYKIAFQMESLLDWHTIDTLRMYIRKRHELSHPSAAWFIDG